MPAVDLAAIMSSNFVRVKVFTNRKICSRWRRSPAALFTFSIKHLGVAITSYLPFIKSLVYSITKISFRFSWLHLCTLFWLQTHCWAPFCRLHTYFTISYLWSLYSGRSIVRNRWMQFIRWVNISIVQFCSFRWAFYMGI